jgi:hypothetical protein
LSFDEIWKILDDLIAEFRKRGETIPPEIMEDLRSAKSFMQISRANSSRSEDPTQIEIYLNNVEFHLIPRAQEKFGQEFVERWTKKLEKARAGTTEGDVETSTVSKFLPGIARDTPWIRVKTSQDIPPDAVKTLAKGAGLSINNKEKDYLLVYGEKRKLQRFLKKMTEKFRAAKKH